MRFAIIAVLLALPSLASAQIDVKAKFCNATTEPVAFALYNAGDPFNQWGWEGYQLAIKSKYMAPCSCATVSTNTNIVLQLPTADIYQMVLRKVGAKEKHTVSVCLDAKGKFRGYLEAGTKTCNEVVNETDFESVNEITMAKGGFPIVEKAMVAKHVKCTKKNWLTACVKMSGTYKYTSGKECSGND